MSQFTLCGFLKGNKPDFHVAMPPQTAKPFYASLVERFQKSYNPSAIKGKRMVARYICFSCLSIKDSTTRINICMIIPLAGKFLFWVTL